MVPVSSRSILGIPSCPGSSCGNKHEGPSDPSAISACAAVTVRYGMREGGFRPDEHPRRAPDGYLRELSRRQAGKSNYTTTFVDATLFSETHIAVGYLILLDNGPTGSRSKGRIFQTAGGISPKRNYPARWGRTAQPSSLAPWTPVSQVMLSAVTACLASGAAAGYDLRPPCRAAVGS